MRARSSRGGGQSSVHLVQNVGWTLGAAGGGPTSEGSQTTAKCNGSAATEDRFQAILALQLANPNNYRYMNATVLAVLWMACCWSGDFQSLGAKAGTFLTILRSTRNCALTGLLPWRLLIQQWRHGNRQHDAFEFLQFLLPRLDAPLFKGEWEAHRQPEGTTDRDPTGYLCLDMSGTDQCLQHYVDGWHHQFSVHAFTAPPKCLIMIFKRYARDNGQNAKNREAIDLQGGTFFVPTFVRGQQQYLPYTVRALTCHFGETLDSGHYRTCLSVVRAGRVNWKITDDGKKAVNCKITPELMRDVYIAWAICEDTNIGSR